MKSNPHKYQIRAFGHLKNNKFAALFMDMGLGKTWVTLRTLYYHMFENFEIKKTLIIAPKFVALDTWPSEIEKWDEFHAFTYSLVLGDQKTRLEALKQDADIYIINRDNVAWLVRHYMTAFPFDCVVIDEISSFKNEKSQRFRALRMIRPKIKRVYGLTGTPAPNGLVDIWAQIYLLDRGVRLGEKITDFQNNYLYPEKIHGYEVTKYAVTKDNEARIYDKIGDICLPMRAADYNQLPPRTDIEHKLHFDKKLRERYLEFERTKILELFENKEAINAVNAAALVNKLLQFSSGAVYNNDRTEAEHIHDLKLDKFEEILEALQGKPVLVAYAFRHEFERMKKRFGGELYKDGCLPRWNAGKIPILYGHPLSIAYGLNMQEGGNNIVWYSQTWSLQEKLQLDARIIRQGQKKHVFVHKLMIAGTMDIDVNRALVRKNTGQEALFSALKVRYLKYTK